jgi:hypothetical protein
MYQVYSGSLPDEPNCNLSLFRFAFVGAECRSLQRKVARFSALLEALDLFLFQPAVERAHRYD